MAILIGIDVGTTNSKAIALDAASGRTLASAQAPTPKLPRPENRIEHDPEALWSTVVGLLREVVAQVPQPDAIRGAAVSSVGEAGVCLDAQGTPVAPVIAWNDPRTIEQEQEWRQRVTAEAQFAISGLPPGHIFTLLKLMWLQKHLPDAWARTRRWLSIADYIAWRLCGVPATSTSQACRTLAFDVGRLRWSDELCAAAGVSPALFAEPVPAGQALGPVAAAAAAQTGLPRHTLVAAGGHDHVCAALAAGAFRPEIVLDSTGTTEALLATVMRPHLDAATRQRELCCGCHVAPGRYYLLAGVLGVGPLIDRLAQVVAPGTPLAAARERLTELARASEPGARGVRVLPFLAGAGAPARCPEASASFLGLREHHTLEDVARATFEGLCHELRVLLEEMIAGAGIATPTLRSVGGGAANEFWLQLKADVTGCPVERPVAREGGALGAALLAGLGAGVFADVEAAYACVATPPARWIPNPEVHPGYTKRHHTSYLPLARQARGLAPTPTASAPSLEETKL